MKVTFFSSFNPKNPLPDIQRALLRALISARRLIGNRTDAGLDYRGQQFEQYADSTKARKIEQNKQSDPPNLTETGNMLGSMTERAQIGNGVVTGEIYFSSANAAKKAAANNRGDPKRKRRPRVFFKLSTQQRREIKDKIQKALFNK